LSDDIELNISVDSDEADPLIAKLDKLNSQMRELKQNSSMPFSALDFLNAKLDAYEGVVGRIRAQRQEAGMDDRPGVPPSHHPTREERREAYNAAYRDFVDTSNGVRQKYGMPPIGGGGFGPEGPNPGEPQGLLHRAEAYRQQAIWDNWIKTGTAPEPEPPQGFISRTRDKVRSAWNRIRNRIRGRDEENEIEEGTGYDLRNVRRNENGYAPPGDDFNPPAEIPKKEPRERRVPLSGLSAFYKGSIWAMDTAKEGMRVGLGAQTKTFDILEGINPLSPFSILKAREKLGGIRGDVQSGIGGMIRNAGTMLPMIGASFGPVGLGVGFAAGGLSQIGGGILEMTGMKGKATASIRESAVGIIGNLASAITTVLGGAVKLAEGGIRLFANTVRSAVGSITQLLGVSVALGTAGAYATTRLVGNEYKSSVNDPMRPFTGISLKQQNIWKQMEQTYGLSENAIYASQLESQRRASSFRTQGQFNNQLPSALAGMIGYMTLDSSFDERVSYLQNAVSKLQNFPSMRNNLENWVNQMGLNTEMQVASMRYEYGLDNSYYAHPRIDEIQRGRIVNGGIYRQLQGVSDAVNDEMANAIYSRGIAGGPSGEQWQKQWIEFKNSLSRSLETGDVMGPLMAGANLFHMAGKQVQTTWDAVTKRFPAINKVGHELVGGVSGALQWGGGLLSIISRIGSARDADDPSKGRVSIGDAFDYIATGIKDVKDRVIKPLVSDITGAFSELGPKITGAIAGGINFLTKPGGIMEGMVNFIANFGENVRGLLDKLFDGVDMNRAVVVGKALMYNVISVFAQGFDAFAEIVDKGVSGLISNTLSRLQWALVPQGIFGEQNDPRTGKKFEGLTMDQGNAWKEVTSSYRKSIAIDWTEFNLETGAGYGKRLGNEEFGKKVFDKGKWSKDGFMPMELIKEYGEHVDEMYRLMEENGYLGTEIDDMIGTVLYSAYTNKGGAGRLPNYMRKSRKEITDNIYAFLTTPQLFSPMSILDSFRGKDKFFDEVIMGSFGAFYDKDKKMFSFENAVEALTPAVESMGEGEAKNLALRVLEEFNRIVEMLGEIFKEGFKIENEVTMKTDEGNQIEIDNSFVTNILGARGRRMVLH
jgi:hypothetical protein